MDFAVWTENNHPGWPFEKVESLRNWSSWEPRVQGGGPRTASNSLWDKSSWASPFLSVCSLAKRKGSERDSIPHSSRALRSLICTTCFQWTPKGDPLWPLPAEPPLGTRINRQPMMPASSVLSSHSFSDAIP